MGPVVRLLQAIARLTQAGAIKKVEDAYKLAKRELGERFGEYKENIKDAFNEGKRKQTIDKRTKNIKKDEEAGIKSLDVKDSGEGFIDFVRKQGDEEGADKLQKAEDEIKKAIEEANKRVADEKGLTDSPLDDLERIVKGEDPPTPTAKEMTERALAEITKKKS